MRRGKILEQVVVIGVIALGSQLLTSARAGAYDFQVCSIGWPAKYVHVHTVSAFCHDRTPVDNGDKVLTYGCVSGSTAPGCLIDNVSFVLTNGNEVHWSGMGVAGGKFTLQATNPGDPYVCYDGYGIC